MTTLTISREEALEAQRSRTRAAEKFTVEKIGLAPKFVSKSLKIAMLMKLHGMSRDEAVAEVEMCKQIIKEAEST